MQACFCILLSESYLFMKKDQTPHRSWFDRFANAATHYTGTSAAFIIAFCLIIAWLISGPVFGYSDTWQLIINTSTTIITFLMVFLIQKSQNKDSMAIQLKLNELLASHELASNNLVDIEDLTEEELLVLKKYYVLLAQMAKKAEKVHQSHSQGKAKTLHSEKNKNRKPEAGKAG